MLDSILFKVDILATSANGSYYDLTDKQLELGAIAISKKIAARINENIDIRVKTYVISWESGCIRCEIGVLFDGINDYAKNLGREARKPKHLIAVLLSCVLTGTNISCSVNVNANDDALPKEIKYNVLPVKTSSVIILPVKDGEGVSHVVERNIQSLRAHRPDLSKDDIVNKLFADNPNCFLKK
ncbi:hypothetical protein [Vibrio parahaemolyticus]|uniref:hypothetical protein n=1 Tax=Vibrio parahaemolyticus TaxID=670 RepID=UPI001120CC44|nr:hypothetical protein [Vibrio parahaemolyticus]TOG38699.1 hypothetical protein CGJ02_23795 [Vibrio parahaemolyticus]